MTPSRTVLAATCLGLVLAGCSQGGPARSAGDAGAESTVPSEDDAPRAGQEWSYDGDTGPQEWAELDAAYEACGQGEQQSPIDLTDAQEADLPPVTFDHRSVTWVVEHLGQMMQATAEDAGGMTIGDERYELLQFHAHTPSEHALEGEHSDAEVHLVHENEQGELAVLALFVHRVEGSFPLSGMWSRLPDEEGETARLPGFDASVMIPDDPTLYRYEGSLTTPPCTEGVRWLVVRESIGVPAGLVDEVERILGNTARPLQPIGDRDLEVTSG